MKKVLVCLNEEAQKFSRGERCVGSYHSSLELARAFRERGFDMNVVHPSEIYSSNGSVKAEGFYDFDDSGILVRIGDRESIRGDVFFVYGLGEDVEDVSFGRRFIEETLPKVERQVGLMVNNSGSTWYEHKPNQKNLPLPWIPGFSISGIDDLVSLVESGEKIIAKPSCGYMGIGVRFLDSIDSAKRFPENQISNFIFEKFVLANEERRFIYLDGNVILERRVEKSGGPGTERISKVEIGVNHSETEREISRRAIEMTGMFFASVDFRGDYLLEINGSGTGLLPPCKEDLYDLAGEVVDAVKKNL